MPPRRAHRHVNVEEVYRREEAQQMGQRINDKFEEGIGKLERMMLEMNQSRRRSPIQNQRGNSVSSSASERRRISPQSDRERRESLDSRRRERDDHGNHDYRYDDERRNRRDTW